MDENQFREFMNMLNSYMRSQQRNNGNNGDSFDWDRYVRNSRFRGSEADAVFNSNVSDREKHKVLKDILREETEKLKEEREKFDEASRKYYEARQRYNEGLMDDEELNEYISKLKEAEQSWQKQSDYCDSIKEKASSTGFGGRVDRINKGLNTTVGNLKDIYNHIQHMVEPWAAADRAASKYAKTIAMTKAGMDNLRKTTIDNVVKNKLGINYNISSDELIEAQQNYVQSVGRSLRIDNAQQESLAAMHAVMGGRENDLAVALENFGVSLNGTADHVGKMFAEASQEGLSFEKYSDNVAKNIKIAQNYTFKNGLKGLESMAKKATAIKMDMSQIASLADKVNNIEGAIGVASKLQVLGGPFASAADPLGMMVEGLTDMEGLTDRITKMIGGLGKFNTETGEIEVSAFNKQRIRAAAEAMGMSYEQLMESVQASERRNQISKQIDASASASKLDDKMKELLKNSGTFENGKAGISVNGEFKSIDELTNEDYEELVKETQDQAADIKDIARNLRSITDIEQGTKKQYEANKAQTIERLHVGEGLKKVVDLVGHSNFLLKIIAYGSFAKDILGIAGNVLGAIGGVGSMFGGGGGGFGGGGFGRRFGNGMGRNAGRFGNGIGSGVKARGTYVNELGRSKWFKGTKAGDAMRKWGAKTYKVGGKMNAKEAKILENIEKNVAGIGKSSAETAKATGRAVMSEKIAQGVGSAALKGNEGLFNVGARLATKGGVTGKLGTVLAEQAIKNEGKMLAGTVAKDAAGKAVAGVAKEKVAQGVGSKLLTGVGKGAGWGALLGVASVGVELGRDALVEKGKIQKGKALDNYLTVTADQAKWAGIGSIAGPWGMLAGAIIGTFTGIAKGVKRQREVVLDAKLERMGIQRQGDYGARRTKLINRALTTGEMSRKTRKKLEKGGDFDIIDAIDKKNEEKKEKKRKDRNERLAAIFGGGGRSVMAKGQFKVGTAYINADNINGGMFGLSKDFGMKKLGLGIGGLGFGLLGKKISDIKGKPETGENKDMGKLMAASKRLMGKDISSFGNLKTNVNQQSSPMDVNINGTIRLVGANGQEVDITEELVNDHNFIRALTNKITEQMGDNRYGSNRQDNNAMGRML